MKSTHLLNRLSQYNLLAPAEHFVRNLVSPNRKAVFSVSVLCLLTYGFVAYNHTFAGDDWPAVIQQGFMYEWTISMGRPLHSLTWILGGDNYLAPAFTLTVMIASLLIAGLIISLPLRLTEELNVFIFLSLIVLCPIWVEHVNFKLNHLAVALAAISTAGASVAIWKATTTDPEYVVSRSRSIIYILIASLLFTVAAATRQEMLIFGLTGILLIVLRDLPRSHKPVKMFTMTISAALIAAVICIGLYAALVAFTRYLFDVSPPPPGSPYRITSSLIGNMEDVTLVLERFRAYFCQFLFSEQHLFPASVKYIFLGSIALLIVGIYRFVLRKYQFHKRAFAVTLWSTFAITALLILPWIIGLIRTPNSYRYSGIVAVSLVFAGIVVLAIEYQENRLLKSFGQISAIFLILVFFFQNNVASSVTFHLNRRDFAIANRILVRLESEQQFEQLWQRKSFDILLVGTPAVYTRRPFIASPARSPMASSIIECGVFNCQNGRINNVVFLLQYGTTHIRWRRLRGLPPRKRASVLGEAANMASWPNSGAIKKISDSEVLLKF